MFLGKGGIVILLHTIVVPKTAVDIEARTNKSNPMGY